SSCDPPGTCTRASGMRAPLSARAPPPAPVRHRPEGAPAYRLSPVTVSALARALEDSKIHGVRGAGNGDLLHPSAAVTSEPREHIGRTVGVLELLSRDRVD